MPSEDPNAELSRQSYWDKRYDINTATDKAKAESYDWLKDFSFVRGFLEKHLPAAETDPKILHLGNGNSTLPASLSTTLHYKSQTAIDFSPIVTTSMRALHQHLTPPINFLEMDIRDLKFPSSTFDICIDKATLDAMLYGSLWEPADEIKENVRRYVDEVFRVLKSGGSGGDGGKFLYITWRQPHFIRPLLKREGWTCEVETVNPPAREGGTGGMLEYFGWVCVKE